MFLTCLGFLKNKGPREALLRPTLDAHQWDSANSQFETVLTVAQRDALFAFFTKVHNRALETNSDTVMEEVAHLTTSDGIGGGDSGRGDGGWEGGWEGRLGGGPGGAIWGGGVGGGGGGGAQAPLTSPCPQSNHTITINLTLTFAASWFGHASHVNWAPQNPQISFMVAFATSLLAILDPNTHSNPSLE